MEAELNFKKLKKCFQTVYTLLHSQFEQPQSWVNSAVTELMYFMYFIFRMLCGKYRGESSFGGLDNRLISLGKLLSASSRRESGSGDERCCCSGYVSFEIWGPLGDIDSTLEYEARIYKHVYHKRITPNDPIHSASV